MHPLAALYPSLFKEFTPRMDESLVIDALESADLDEAAARRWLMEVSRENANPEQQGGGGGEGSHGDEKTTMDTAAAKPLVKLFCVCQSIDDESRMMVQCEGGCQEWFHPACVGLSEEEAEILDKYICDKCGGVDGELVTGKSKRSSRTTTKAKASSTTTPPASRKRVKKSTTTTTTTTTDNLTEPVSNSPTLETVTRDEDEILRDIARVEQELLAPLVIEEEDPDESLLWRPPPFCVPIRADVRTFDFMGLAKAQKELTGRLFDVILTDPPWQLATSNPTRGVAIGYDQLSDNLIKAIPFPNLQENGFLFMWVINAKYALAMQLFSEWGYTLVDEITWVKRTVNRRLAKSHGFYLQHAKETCLVARKGQDPPGTQYNVSSDVIYAERRGQSQKPTEIYELIEKLVPGGYYLEVFGRRNNTRDGFLTIGNEL